MFAGDLFHMYAKFADAKGWKTAVMDAAPSDLGGFKEIIFLVEGTDVYKTLRYESGGTAFSACRPRRRRGGCIPRRRRWRCCRKWPK